MLKTSYRLLKPLLFRMGAETAHNRLLASLAFAPDLMARAASWGAGPPPSMLAREVAGLRFAGPVGLAAGLDKDGLAIPVWEALGFGFVEVGTVTAHAQAGNPRPRLFRLVQDRALVNRMGFNNRGSAVLAERLGRLKGAGRWPGVPLGVNVGKSKITPPEEAVADYVTSIERLVGLADYFTVNVSSPNTPGLRDLQERSALERLLPAALRAAEGTPLFLKLSPDLSESTLSSAVRLAASLGVSGVIATNTTIARPLAAEAGEFGLSRDPEQPGGLSGRPLWPLARQAIATALAAADGRIPVIGVGGVSTSAQARELLDAGCAAVQLYTGLIFEGPGLPSRLHRELAKE